MCVQDRASLSLTMWQNVCLVSLEEREPAELPSDETWRPCVAKQLRYASRAVATKATAKV
jgi:hypothetical protein